MKRVRLNSLCVVFTLTYIAMMARRAVLELWSLSKSQIEVDLSLSSTILGLYDTSYLISYAIGEPLNGMLSDRLGESLMISLGLGTASIGLLIVSFM